MSSRVKVDELEGNEDSTLIETISKFKIKDMAWDHGHFVLGDYHIWTDEDGHLRMQDHQPRFDTDGVRFLTDLDIAEGVSGFSGYSGQSTSGYSGFSGFAQTQQFPVGFVYVSVLETDPAELLGYGSWVRMPRGRFLVHHDPNQEKFNVSLKEGGSITKDMSHSHSQDSHTHEFILTEDPPNYSDEESEFGPVYGAGVKFKSQKVYKHANYGGGTVGQGGNQNHDVLPPFIVVHMWKRIA